MFDWEMLGTNSASAENTAPETPLTAAEQEEEISNSNKLDGRVQVFFHLQFSLFFVCLLAINPADGDNGVNNIFQQPSFVTGNSYATPVIQQPHGYQTRGATATAFGTGTNNR